MTLSDYLNLRGVTQSEFAAEIGVEPCVVNRYVNGRRIPRHDIMARIVKATCGAVTPSDLFGSYRPPASRQARQRPEDMCQGGTRQEG